MSKGMGIKAKDMHNLMNESCWKQSPRFRSQMAGSNIDMPWKKDTITLRFSFKHS